MNKEEAIKQLKKHKQEIDKQYISSRYSKAIEVALNLIQTQDKEIQLLSKKLYLCTPEIPQNNHQEYVSYVDLVEKIIKQEKIIENAINEVEKIRQYFSEDVQVEFIRILEILKDKNVKDW